MQNIKPEFRQWIANQLGGEAFTLVPLTGDASFRSYYRAATQSQNYIVMLAPPEKERTDAFVAIANAWHAGGICVPEVMGWEPQQGFVLLSDFGDTLLLDKLNPHTADDYYHQAMQMLPQLQRQDGGVYPLPLFDEAHIRLELSYFQDWFLTKLLNIDIPSAIQSMLENVYAQLVICFQAQPQVTVHRDYHSRNLMVLPHTLGVIDFQDAMLGPITYDIVSLLKDCYIRWDNEQIEQWVRVFHHTLPQTLLNVDETTFLRWFDWVGLQRHMKVLGIFSRLHLRDNKPRYLDDIPRILNYVLNVTSSYPEWRDFDRWCRLEVLPRLEQLPHFQHVDFKVA